MYLLSKVSFHPFMPHVSVVHARRQITRTILILEVSLNNRLFLVLEKFKIRFLEEKAIKYNT